MQHIFVYLLVAQNIFLKAYLKPKLARCSTRAKEIMFCSIGTNNNVKWYLRCCVYDEFLHF